MTNNSFDFYVETSFMADHGDHADLFSELPDDIPGLCKVVQGLLIHQYWAGAYNYSIPQERASEHQIRDVAGKKVEILGWDYWGLIEGDDANLDEDDLTLLDRAATLSLAGNDGFHELRSLYLEICGCACHRL